MSADAAALTLTSFKKSPEPALVVEAWKELEVVQEWGGWGNLVKVYDGHTLCRGGCPGSKLIERRVKFAIFRRGWLCDGARPLQTGDHGSRTAQ